MGPAYLTLTIISYALLNNALLITCNAVRVINNALFNTSYRVTWYGRVIEWSWSRYGRVITERGRGTLLN